MTLPQTTNCRSARRLLFLLPFAPRLDATHGGGRVTAQLLARLATRHRIALLYLRAPNEAPLDPVLQEKCEIAEEVLRFNGSFSFAQRWSRIALLLRGWPMWAIFTAVAGYRTRLRALARTWRPDVVQVEYHVMAQYLSALDACPAPRVLIEHEPGIRAARDLWRSHKGLRQAIAYVNLRAWQRFEQPLVKKVQAVVVFTERDRQEVSQFGSSTPIVRIPIGTLLPRQPLSPLGCSPLSLILVGSFVHPPNVDAAMRLITEIFPQVQAVFPELILYVVGDRPPRPIRQLANKKIIVTGYVPDVAPYLDSATLVVAPLRLGGGMRVKVLEALAAGKPIVASPLAVEGLDVKDGEHIVVAENVEQFSKAIIRLLADRDRRVALGARARAWARDNLNWETSVAAYETLYENLLTGSTISEQT